jgi:hypothetical protein
MKFGEFIREDFLKNHRQRYKILCVIQAPTIIRWNQRNLIRKWTNTKRQPVPGFNKFKDVDIIPAFVTSIPKCRGLWKIWTTDNKAIYFKKGRHGFYFDDKD